MEPVHVTVAGAAIALAFVASIGSVIVWMLRLPEQTPTSLRVAKAMRMADYANLILVPVLGTALSDRMVALGAQMAKARKSEMVVFCVIEVPWSLPLSAHLEAAERMAQEALDRAQRITNHYDVPLTSRIIHARGAGTAIVEEAVNSGADIILMGDLPGRAGETRFNAATNYVFTHAPCEVVIDRPALDNLFLMLDKDVNYDPSAGVTRKAQSN